MPIPETHIPREATIVVAASDSLSPSADYICNGTDDQVEIQAAIDALPAGGGSIKFLEGTYVFENLQIDKSNVTFEGCGSATEFKLQDARHSTLSAQALLGQPDIVVVDGSQFRVGDFVLIIDANSVEAREVINIVGNTLTVEVNLTFTHPFGAEVWTLFPLIMIKNLDPAYFSISNIYLDGNNANQVSGQLGYIFPPGCANNACSLVDGTGDACYDLGLIHFYSTAFITMENCWLYHAPSEALWGWDCRDIKVASNRIYDVADKGIAIAFPAGWVGGTISRIAILDNQIDTIGNGEGQAAAGQTWGDAMQFHTSDYVLIRNNYVRQWRRAGLMVDGGTKWEVVNNVFIDNAAYAIAAGRVVDLELDDSLLSGTIAIIGADIKRGHSFLLICERCHITDTIIQGGGDSTNASANTVTLTAIDTVVDGCVIENSQGGRAAFRLITGSNNVLVSNLIVKNAVTANTDGIRVEGPITNCWFEHCRVYDDQTPKIMRYAFIATGVCSNLILRDSLLESVLTATFYNPELITMFEQHSDLFMDVLVASANYIVNAQNLVNGAVALTGTQPKYPRGLVFAITEGAPGDVSDYTMTVVGTNGKGETITEVFTFAVDGLAWLSDNAFDHVTSVTLADVADIGAATFDVGIDERLGLMNVIYETTDVWKIIKNGVKQTVAVAQVDVDYDSYDMSVITLAATDDFEIWYRHNLNIIV